MGELIDMRMYRLRKSIKESRPRRGGKSLMTAAELLRLKRCSEGKELHEVDPSLLEALGVQKVTVVENLEVDFVIFDNNKKE